MIDTKELRRLAELATGGEWIDDAYVGEDPYDDPDTPFVEIGGVKWMPSTLDVPAALDRYADASYIAAANPKAIIELLDMLELSTVNGK